MRKSYISFRVDPGYKQKAELQEEWRRGTRDAVGDRLNAIIARFAVAWEGLKEDG